MRLRWCAGGQQQSTARAVELASAPTALVTRGRPAARPCPPAITSPLAAGRLYPYPRTHCKVEKRVSASALLRASEPVRLVPVGLLVALVRDHHQPAPPTARAALRVLLQPGPGKVAIRSPFVRWPHVVARRHASALSRPGARFQRQACSGIWCRPRLCRGPELLPRHTAVTLRLRWEKAWTVTGLIRNLPRALRPLAHETVVTPRTDLTLWPSWEPSPPDANLVVLAGRATHVP